MLYPHSATNFDIVLVSRDPIRKLFRYLRLSIWETFGVVLFIAIQYTTLAIYTTKAQSFGFRDARFTIKRPLERQCSRTGLKFVLNHFQDTNPVEHLALLNRFNFSNTFQWIGSVDAARSSIPQTNLTNFNGQTRFPLETFQNDYRH